MRKTKLGAKSKSALHTRARRKQIAGAIAEIKGLKPVSTKAAKVVALMRSWLEDESGYDEKTWPALKKSLDDERWRVGARRLVCG